MGISLNTEVVYYRSRQELRMLNILLYAILITCVSCVPAGDEGGSCGSDERGLERQPGDSWQEDCNRCRCLSTGVKGCTRKFCGGEVSRKCVDSDGQARQEGERWEEVPDMCSCTEGVVVCTSLAVITGTKIDRPSEVRFPGRGSSKDRSLFTRQTGKDVSNTVQCRQTGVTQCIPVTVNQSTGSVFASIRPNTGPVIFYVEACGQGCTVMYQRQKSFFNQFTD